jgi:hypothetical protein
MRNQIAWRCAIGALVAAVGLVAGCGGVLAPTTTEPASFTWPASLAAFGDGYPNAGDACRRLGESAETSAYLDHTATLVGCPGRSDSAGAQALVRERHGRVVGEARGVTLISVPELGGGSE